MTVGRIRRALERIRRIYVNLPPITKGDKEPLFKEKRQTKILFVQLSHKRNNGMAPLFPCDIELLLWAGLPARGQPRNDSGCLPFMNVYFQCA